MNLTKKEQRDEAWKTFRVIANPAWKTCSAIVDPAREAQDAIVDPAWKALVEKLDEIDEQKEEV